MNSNNIRRLEFFLTSLFLIIWLGIVSGRIHNLDSARISIEKKLHSEHYQLENTGKLLISRMCEELVPSLYHRSVDKGNNIFLPFLKELIQKELFPIQRYSIDYWNDTASFKASYSDTVPDYFLESDETNEEPKKEDPGIIPGKGTGKTYSLKKLSDRDFLLNHFYIVDETTSMSEEETDAGRLLKKDLSLDLSGNEPLVLIYHTHGSESYRKAKGREGTVVEVGEALKKELEEKYHIPTVHDTSIYDMVNGELDRSRAYNYAAEGVSAILKKNPGIKVVIDLHRDSVSDNIRLTTKINGRKTAQIMFFNGVSRRKGVGDIDYLNNPNKLGNLAFSLQMQLLAAKYYPGLTRKIYIKGYRYNLHLKKRATLIEVGAQNNTVKEAKNAMKPLAELLFRLLSGEKAYRKPYS